MKIVMLSEFFNEGLEYQENLLARYYRKHGHDVTVITSTTDNVHDFNYKPNHASSRTYEVDGIKVVRLRYRYNLLNRYRPFTCINALLEQENPDLIFVHDIMPNLTEVVQHLKSHMQCRAIMAYHADYSNSGKNWLSLFVLHRMLRGRVLNKARPYLSKIFPVVPAGFSFLNEVYGVPYCEMELLPLGADVDAIEEVRKADARNAVRRRLAIPIGATVIFTGGKLEPRKRTDTLIQALPLLRRGGHVIIAGEVPPEQAAYKAKIETLIEENPNVHFAGWLSPRDVYAHMIASDLAVFPRSQSIMWQQAIASGLPLIVGTTKHQDHGYLNVHRNLENLDGDTLTEETLAAAIENVISNPNMFADMKTGADLAGRELLDWNVLISKTLRFVTSSPA